jgi:hypothetical protein
VRPLYSLPYRALSASWAALPSTGYREPVNGSAAPAAPAKPAAAKGEETHPPPPCNSILLTLPKCRHPADQRVVPLWKSSPRLSASGVQTEWTLTQKNDRVPSEWTPSPR